MLLLEELTEKQTDMVDSWLEQHHSERAVSLKNSNHVFTNGDRITVPVSVELQPPSKVASFVSQRGYSISNYRAGLATEPKYNRSVRIGRILQAHNAPKDVLQAYHEDPQRTRRSVDSHAIVFTRDPYDISGCSTGRSWKSCLTMANPESTDPEARKGGAHYRQLSQDIARGVINAYLVAADDHHISDPIARIRIKPYIHKDHVIYRPEPTIYGENPFTGFHTKVKEWCEHHFPAKPGAMYALNKHVYDDGAPTHVFDADTISTDDIDRLFDRDPDYHVMKSLYDGLNHQGKHHLLGKLLQRQSYRDVDHLDRIANSGHVEHQKVLLDSIKILPSRVIKTLVAKAHPSIKREVHQQALDHPKYHVDINGNRSINFLHEFDTKLLVAHHSDDPETLRKLLDTDFDEIRIKVLRNPASHSLHHELASDPYYHMPLAVLTPHEDIRQMLMKSSDPAVRDAAKRNPHTRKRGD